MWLVYKRMRDAFSSGQPKATSLRACARSDRGADEVKAKTDELVLAPDAK
jgi:hypothetical protein